MGYCASYFCHTEDAFWISCQLSNVFSGGSVLSVFAQAIFQSACLLASKIALTLAIHFLCICVSFTFCHFNDLCTLSYVSMVTSVRLQECHKKEGLNAMSLIDSLIGLEHVLLCCSKPKVSSVHMLAHLKIYIQRASKSHLVVLFLKGPSLSLRQSVSILPCFSV